MTHNIQDAQDYIGGKPIAGRIMVVDAGGRWTQGVDATTDLTAVTASVLANTNSIASHAVTLNEVKSTPIFVGLKIGNLFSTTAASLGFFTVTPVSQQALLATLSTAIDSLQVEDSTVLAVVLNSLGLSFNSLNLYFKRFGLESSV